MINDQFWKKQNKKNTIITQQVGINELGPRKMLDSWLLDICFPCLDAEQYNDNKRHIWNRKRIKRQYQVIDTYEIFIEEHMQTL